MSKYEIECKVATRALNALRKLADDPVAYDTQLLMLERHMRKLRAGAPAIPSSEHLAVQAFLDAPETHERIGKARITIRQIVSNRNRKALLKANRQFVSFRSKARWAKSVGVGFGQVHKPIEGGAPDSNRRRH